MTMAAGFETLCHELGYQNVSEFAFIGPLHFRLQLGVYVLKVSLARLMSLILKLVSFAMRNRTANRPTRLTAQQ